ncbi:MAG: hypothetical protein WCK67_10175 [bacterium]
MRKSKHGNNLVEYIVTLSCIGFVFGYALWNINPDIFKNIFQNTFSGSTDNSGQLTIQPMTK